MPQAVRYEEFGGIDVLKVVEIERPVPGAGQVLVRVKAAGINPGEASIRAGAFQDVWRATFPSGHGSDLAGVVEELGDGVEVANVDVLDELAAMISDGTLEIPIARVYPLSEVRNAYRELERRHIRGKIVLEP
jgi:NADPH:quinone reductase-like Zn-dependent oxidoreductase